MEAKCQTYELTKEQIDSIESAVNKIDSKSYFGPKSRRYARNITDNGLLEINVDDLFQSISTKAWDEIHKTISPKDQKYSTFKDEINSEKVLNGELKKKPLEERVYKEISKKL